jgi:hypothetical protein
MHKISTRNGEMMEEETLVQPLDQASADDFRWSLCHFLTRATAIPIISIQVIIRKSDV